MVKARAKATAGRIHHRGAETLRKANAKAFEPRKKAEGTENTEKVKGKSESGEAFEPQIKADKSGWRR